MNIAYYDSPIGRLAIAGENGKITRLFFENAAVPAAYQEAETPEIREAIRQLREYFDGKRSAFDLPLAPKGTDFQRAVWAALRAIPPGQTRSYGEIAAQIGNPKAQRAVGMANNRNPLAIFIPCHRVLGANGSLTGFAGGLAVKQYLLDLEKQYA